MHPCLLPIIRHFAERVTRLPEPTFFPFSGLQMGRQLHESVASAVDGKEGQIAMDHGEEGRVVRLRGRLNIDTSPSLRDQLLTMLRAPSPERVIVNLTDVTYIDSSGIATLIEGLRMARMRQTTLCLQGLQGRLLHFFQATGILTLFETSDCGSPPSVSKVS